MNFSIIVTYYPNIPHLLNMCDSLIKANTKIIIFDNTPYIEKEKHLKLSIFEHIDKKVITIIGDGVNHGLSVAFNQSIIFAVKNNTSIEAFLFFDQDSTLTSEKILSLISKYNYLKCTNIPVGVLGALPVDTKGAPYFVRKSKDTCNKVDSKNYICSDFVISSFSLVPKTTLDKIGLFDEKLFIDLVDSEFSYRCTKNNLLNLVSKQVQFKHVIGERRGNFFGLRSFAISSPIRNYYQARNLILVGIDYGWYGFIVSKISKRFFQVILSSFYDGNFATRMKYFFKGVAHGISYKGGPHNDS